MKSNLTLIVLLLLITATFFSCGQEIPATQTTSPDGNRKITITGERAVALDPIMVGILIETEKGSKDFQFEVMAPTLSDETVKIDWASNDKCNITFLQDNGSKKIQKIDLTEGNVHVQQDVELSKDAENMLENLH